MNKLTLKIEYSNYLNDEFKTYLLGINGIKDVLLDLDNDTFTVSYDESIISDNIMLKEIYLFLDFKDFHYIVSFDKHKEHAKKHTIIIEDLCCEYCLMGAMEDLFEIDGIISGYSDFDLNNYNKKNVNIFITYDDIVISEDKLKELEIKLNK